MFEKSKWIARCDNIEEIVPAPLFRKSFNVKKKIKSAMLSICGLGHSCYYINGISITDEVLTTPVSKYDTRVYYSSYDLTDKLNVGENTFGCILGNGWYLVTYPRWDRYIPDWKSHPKLIAELKIEYTDGETEYICSDTSWKTSDSAIVYNENRRGEIYDARLCQKGWAENGFDENKWDNAFICKSPGGVPEEIDFPVIKVIRQIKAEKISDNVYDLGENISGWARIKVKGISGAEVTLRYAEALHDDGGIYPELSNTIMGAETHTDKYILCGEGTEEWAPSFAYHGFRYIEVSGDFDEIEIIGEVVHTDLKTIGTFSCSNDMLNKIHEASVRSTLTNMHGIPTDCPQREQNGWTGDALISAEQTLMNFDAAAIYKKWLKDIADTQRPSGQICCIAPTGGWGYNWGSGPAWDSALILIPHYVYKYCGDKSLIEMFWSNMALYMNFLDSMEENNLVCFGLGDWCPPENTDVCPTVITDTAFYYKDNTAMAEMAQIIGADSKKYLRRAKEIKTAFRSNFIEKDFCLNDNTTAIGCAIYNDLYNEDEKPEAAKILSDIFENGGYHINCGILGIKFLFTALCEYGYQETAYRLVTNPEYPSYAYWINQGMTTLCEHWDMTDSRNHHMYSEVDMWMYKYIAGIRISEGGERILIKPCRLKDVEWVRATHKDISVCLTREFIEIDCKRAFEIEVNDKAVNCKAGMHKIYFEKN